MIAQSLGVYNDLVTAPGIMPLANLLFSFWFAPLAMAMFLDPEHETGRLDALIALDFVQAVLVCVAAYLYFFYFPKADAPAELAHSVWTPYFAGYGLVAGAFMVRSTVTRSRDVARVVRPHGDFPRPLGVRRRLVLLRPRTRDENWGMVRPAVERAAGRSHPDRDDLEADGGA